MCLIIVCIHNVSKNLSDSDKKYIDLLFQGKEFNKDKASYKDQIEFISTIQKTFNAQIELAEGIGLNEPREPQNLYEIKKGECYDRSRFLEKTFNYYGFKTRHLTAFTLRHNGKVIKALLSKNHITHSTFEVKTSNGWLLVDPNFNWLALKGDNSPLRYKQISKTINKGKAVDWHTDPPRTLMHFYIQESFCIYGLYSRHGRFYHPYNPIPDYNLRELLYNF